MKTYFKRSHEKSLSTVFYSSLDTLYQFPSRIKFRQRIVQPSTKEQQRLLSAYPQSTRYQHVHSGKYGIKPLGPSDELSCEQWQQIGKSNKHRSASKGLRDRCLSSKSDLQKNSILSSLSNLFEDSQSIYLLTSVSLLLLLLLIFILYRRHSSKSIEHKQTKRRLSLENNLIHDTTDYHIPPIHTLPTIVEESSPILSPINSPNPFTKPTSPSIISDTNDSGNLSSINSNQQQESSTTKTPKDENINIVRISIPIKDESTTPRRRRSRFEQEPSKTNDEPLTINHVEIPSVMNRKGSIQHQNVIKDDFKSLKEIDDAVKQVGLVRSQLIFGIDYTISNLETGKNSFNGLSLHNIQDGLLNPYQSVITIVGRTLEKFDSDTLIPAFGFGDRATLDRKIFPLRPDGSYCKGFRGVLDAYNEITPKVRMSGPTNFAPLIREAIRIVKKTRQYHILVIVADGQVTNEKQTKDAIVEASNYPLSIVMIGVGDGPWDMMEEFDDSLPTRQFDNFQFVNYNSIVEAAANDDSTFALHALMEIPSQYAAIKDLGLLKDS